MPDTADPAEGENDGDLDYARDDGAEDGLPYVETEGEDGGRGLPAVDCEEDGRPKANEVEVLPLSPAYVDVSYMPATRLAMV